MRLLEFNPILMDVSVFKNSVGLKSIIGMFLNNASSDIDGLVVHYHPFLDVSNK